MDQLKSDTAFPAFMFSTAYNIFCKQLRRKRFSGKYNEAAATFLENTDASPELITELTFIFEKMKKHLGIRNIERYFQLTNNIAPIISEDKVTKF